MVANSSEANQQEVDDAVQALNTAIATFNEAIIIADPGVVKTGLTVAIKTAQNWVDTIATGTEPGQVSAAAETALSEAIATAQLVANRSEANQQEVDDAVQALNTAIETFNEAIIIADPGVVKTGLTVAITTAQNWVDTIATGTEPVQVSAATKTALTEAIATAQLVANSSEANQQEVDVAVQALNTAIATFNEAIIIADPGVVKTGLTVAIKTAQNWVDTIATGTEPGQVSAAAETALSEAIATAQLVANSSEANQQEVDDAVQALNTAIATFNEAIIIADPGVVKKD